MRLDVRHVVLTIKRQNLELEQINNMLRVAADSGFCDVSLVLSEENTKFVLRFEQIRTSLFVEEWVKFWMRPFAIDYSLDFDAPENGSELVTERKSFSTEST